MGTLAELAQIQADRKSLSADVAELRVQLRKSRKMGSAQALSNTSSFEKLAARKPQVRQYERTGYLTDGKRLAWEYSRDAAHGEQMDFMEAMETQRGWTDPAPYCS
jgi:hypothetical protein